MPSIEFVLPEKLLFIFSNISVISFCFFISFLFAKLFRSFLMFFLLSISIASIFYGDIFLKYGIGTYHILFNMDSKILIKAQKNLNDKIESLDLKEVYIYLLKNAGMLSLNDRYEISKVHEKYVDKFIDIATYSTRFNRYSYDTERIYLNGNGKILDEKPRYEVIKKQANIFFDTVYLKDEFLFRDKLANVVIATAFSISFKPATEKFRNKHLFWSLEKEEEFNPKPIQNFDNIYKKLFMD